jgi:hypothetical protein
MATRIIVGLLSFALSAAASSAIAAAKHSDRLALVIGNANYPDSDPPLRAPINNARELAGELERHGFDVEIGENLSGDAMRGALDRLYTRIRPGAVALLFFSGFGIQSNRQSFMLPVDAQIWTEADVRRYGLNLETVLGEINSRGAGVKIALIDASRRNPFERRFRGLSAGLAPVVVPNGTIVMYSAAPSAIDDRDERSLFVQELIREMGVPNLKAEETLNHTRIAVSRASRSEEVPWISSSLTEQFSFDPDTGEPQSPTGAPSVQSDIRRDYDATLQLGSKQAWETFLVQYPTGFYAGLAKLQLDKIAAEESLAAATESARLAAEEKVRLTTEGAAKALRDKAEEEEKSVEASRVAAEKSKELAQKRLVEGEKASQKSEKVTQVESTTQQASRPKNAHANHRRSKCFSFNGDRYCE